MDLKCGGEGHTRKGANDQKASRVGGVPPYVSDLVRVSIAMSKHHDQKAS